MNIRMATVTAATLALLAACSKAPETADAAADHEEHADAAAAAPVAPAVMRKPAPAGASVSIVSPRDGETVSSPVKVVFGITGMTLSPAAPAGADVPNTGHHHLLIDTELADPNAPIPADTQHVHFGKAQTEGEVTLAPGTHTLQLVLGDYLHIPFDPVIASPKVTITVK
jgi:hypothetical protein